MEKKNFKNWMFRVVITDILQKACNMAEQKTPGAFQAEAERLAQDIRNMAKAAGETPKELADEVIDEVLGLLS